MKALCRRSCGRAPTGADRILVTPYQPQIVAMADRGFAGGHADLRAGFFSTEAEERRTITRLRRQPVPNVLFDAGEIRAFHESFPLLAEYFEAHYDDAGARVVDDCLTFALLVENDRKPRRAWEPLQWPCVA